MTSPPWFAFLIHPRDITDLHRWNGGSLLRRYCTTEDEFIRRALDRPPLVVGELFFPPSAVRGELIATPALSTSVISSRGRALIAQATQLAAQRGAAVVGLGALTGPATASGLSLLPSLPPGITLTNGNAYTAAVLYHNTLEAMTALNLSRTARIAVVGATGSVGQTVSRLLAAAGTELTLIGRTVRRVETLLHDLTGQARYTANIEEIRHCDIILLLTADPSAQLSTTIFHNHTTDIIAIDAAQPPNVPPEEYPRFQKIGVTVTPGGLVSIPHLVSTQDLNTPPGQTYACLAETYLFAREGIREHSIGTPTIETTNMLERISHRYDVHPEPLHLAPVTKILPPAQKTS